MAFDATTFARASSHNNANIPQLWLYQTTDAITTVDDADYFLDKHLELTPGDLIMCCCGTSGTAAAQILMVTASSATTVTTQVAFADDIT